MRLRQGRFSPSRRRAKRGYAPFPNHIAIASARFLASSLSKIRDIVFFTVGSAKSNSVAISLLVTLGLAAAWAMAEGLSDVAEGRLGIP